MALATFETLPWVHACDAHTRTHTYIYKVDNLSLVPLMGLFPYRGSLFVQPEEPEVL